MRGSYRPDLGELSDNEPDDDLQPPWVSKCCQAPLRLHSADEGTNFYVCTKCGEATDAVRPATEEK